MKLFISALIATSMLTAGVASARPMHHRHKVCVMRRHHPVCTWR